MTKIIYLLFKGIELLFLLPLCMCSKLVFNTVWGIYYKKPIRKNIFNLCVQWLLYIGDKVGLNYYQINVLIFCIIWPVITIFSIILNILLILF